jgi:hypothetical protein
MLSSVTVDPLLDVPNKEIMRSVGYVAHMRKMRNAYRMIIGKPEGNISFKIFRNVREVLRWLLNYSARMWTEFRSLRIGTSSGLLLVVT